MLNVFDKNTAMNIVRSPELISSADIWLIHGFTESSKSFFGVFDRDLSNKFNIFIPDLPGFGGSEFNRNTIGLKNVINRLKELIDQYSPGKQLILVGHSLGSTLATMLAPSLENIKLFINVEGMLVEDCQNARSLTKAHDYTDPVKFVEHMQSKLAESAQKDFFANRYLNKIISSDPSVLHAWAVFSTDLLAENKVDKVYRSLACKKVYVYGENTMSKLEPKHLAKNKYERVVISNAGHWPMLERPKEFWDIVEEEIYRVF